MARLPPGTFVTLLISQRMAAHREAWSEGRLRRRQARHCAGARRAPDHPDRRRRHAGRDLDAELIFGMGRGRHRIYARQFGADHHRRAGGFIRRDLVLHRRSTGMPVLQVWKAGTVMFIKRSLASGDAGIDNPLFP